MNTVFLSYGHDDHVDTILNVKRSLEENGFTVWIDQEGLVGGSDWEEKLESAISSQNKFVFCITPHSVRRPDGYCLNEISYAVTKGKDIIPIMVDDSGATQPLSICRLQWLDMLNLKDLDSDESQKKFNSSIELLCSILKDQSSLGLNEKFTSLSKILEHEDFSLDIEKHTKNFIGREWVFRKMNEWIKNNSDSRVLWITANAGYGKSALSANLTHKISNIAGIFFCQYNRDIRQKAKVLLKTLAYQLSTQIPQYKALLSEFSAKDFELFALNSYDFLHKVLLAPLSKISLDKTYILVIDALDEAYNEDGHNEIIELISEEFEKFPDFIKFIITSRPEPSIKRQLSRLQPIELSATQDGNIDDLINYCKINIHTDDLDDETIMKLVDKSEGNILYLKEVIEDISKGRLSLATIDSFPQGLSGTYEQFFIRKFSDIDDYEENAMQLLELLTAARKPIPKELIINILNWNKRSLKKNLTQFGSFLEERDEKISFYHKSIIDWLIDEDLCSEDYWIDTQEGDKKFYNYFIDDFNKELYSDKLIEFFPFDIVPSEHKNYYSSLEKISSNLIKVHNYDKAEFFCKKLIKNCKQHLGKEHTNTFNAMSKQFEILLLKGEFNKAEEAIKELINQKESSLGKEHLSTLNSMERLAHIYRRKGQYDDSEKLYKSILNTHNKNSIEYFTVLKEYALVLTYLSNFIKAGDELKKALDYFEGASITQEQLLQNASLLNIIGFNMRFLNRHNEAFAYIEEAIQIQEKYQDDEIVSTKVDVATSYNNYATASLEIHNLDRAKIFLKKSANIRKELFTDEHADVLVSRMSLANYHYVNEEFLESKEILLEVLASRQKIYNRTHAYISRTLRDLARCELALGNETESLELFNQTLMLRQETFGDQHPVVANIYYDLAKCHYSISGSANKEVTDYLNLAFDIYNALYLTEPDYWYYFVYKIALVKFEVLGDKESEILINKIEEIYKDGLTDSLIKEKAFDFEFKY